MNNHFPTFKDLKNISVKINTGKYFAIIDVIKNSKITFIK